MLAKFFDMELPKHAYMVDQVHEESLSVGSDEKETIRNTAFSDVVYSAVQKEAGVRTPDDGILVQNGQVAGDQSLATLNPLEVVGQQ